MTKRFQLTILLSYEIERGYTQLLKSRELVTQSPATFTFKFVNNSEEAFPSTTMRITFIERGQTVGTGGLRWVLPEEVNVPKIEVSKSSEVTVDYSFVPLTTGISELRLEFNEPPDTEIYLSKSAQSQYVRNRASYPFYVLGWQELETMKLLRRLIKGK